MRIIDRDFHAFAIDNAINNRVNAIVPQPAPNGYKELIDTGHAFRGKFLDRCSLIEEWAIRSLQAAEEKSKSNYLFGQKLSAVRKMAESSPSRFKSPKKVIDLLDRFQPFAELRSTLAHANQSVAKTATAGIIMYRPIGVSGSEAGWRQIVLEQDECAAILHDIGQLANEFRQQTVTAKV